MTTRRWGGNSRPRCYLVATASVRLCDSLTTSAFRERSARYKSSVSVQVVTEQCDQAHHCSMEKQLVTLPVRGRRQEQCSSQDSGSRSSVVGRQQLGVERTAIRLVSFLKLI